MMPLINHAWKPLFGNAFTTNNKITERRWYPLNYALLKKNTEVLKPKPKLLQVKDGNNENKQQQTKTPSETNDNSNNNNNNNVPLNGVNQKNCN